MNISHIYFNINSIILLQYNIEVLLLVISIYFTLFFTLTKYFLLLFHLLFIFLFWSVTVSLKFDFLFYK